MTTLLNSGATLDPANVRLTQHVVERYIERRGWGRDRWNEAQEAIRLLLVRVAHQNPRIMCKPGQAPTRRFQHGDLYWVVTADFTTVITFYSRKRGK